MPTFTQANRALAVTTPLGPDVLLLEKLSGSEAISELFRFQLEMLALAPVDFARVLNQPATVRLSLPNGSGRVIHGIVAALAQGGQVPGPAGKGTFIRYTAELVPALWRLTRRVQSRVFQNLTVPQILEKILATEWRLEVVTSFAGAYQPRNYCVQYHESDFAFISRLMEEEGIGYFFTHDVDAEKKTEKHTLHLSDHSAGYGKLARAEATYQPQRGGTPQKPVIWDWEKRQEVTTALHTLSDYHFQLPDSRLVARANLEPTVPVGSVTHPLRVSHKIGDQEMLEVFDYPAAYAARFDDWDASGNARGNEMRKLHDDAVRTARLRAEEAAAGSMRVRGESACGHFLPGHQFTLQRHFDADGVYLLTRITHAASIEGAYTSGDSATAEPHYENHFESLPVGLVFRPQRRTPRPRIEGTQTATVTAPVGAPIFVDVYGRVKVKFHWDRTPGETANHSCWVRVSQAWAGPGYGAFFWPRAGHEVVVSFEDGDPDRPLITGSVYNHNNMPPFVLPKNQTMTGIKSCSLGGDPTHEANWLVFHDDPGNEHFHLHSETHEVITSGASKRVFTPGTKFDVIGTFPLASLMGSGSGGGPLTPFGSSLVGAAFPPPGSGGGGGLCDFIDLGAAIGETQHHKPDWLVKYEASMPGSTSLVDGTVLSGIFFGDRVAHTLLGAKIEMHADIEALITDYLAEAQVPLLSSLSRLFYSGISGALFGGLGGVNVIQIGPINALNYGGPFLNVSRGKTTLRKEGAKAGKLIKLLGLAALVTNMLTHCLNRKFALKEETVDEGKVAAMRKKIAKQKKQDAAEREEKAKEDKEKAEQDEHKAATDMTHADSTEKLEDATRRHEDAEQRKHEAEEREHEAEEDRKKAEEDENEAHEHAEKVEEEKEKHEADVAWVLLAKRAIVSRLMALLNIVEKLHADEKSAQAKKDEAVRIVKHVPLDWNVAPHVVHAAKSASEQAFELLKSMALDLLGMGEHEEHEDAHPPEFDIHKGDVSVAGKNITIFSRVEKDTVPALDAHGGHHLAAKAPDSTTSVNLIAEGNGKNGLLNLIATKQVYITQDRASYLAMTKDKGVELHAPKSITIWTKNVLTGPRIEMTDNSIRLTVGSKLNGAFLELTDKTITASVPGLVGPAKVLTVTDEGYSDIVHQVKLPAGVHLACGPWAVGVTEKETYNVTTPVHKQENQPGKIVSKALIVDDQSMVDHKHKAMKSQIDAVVLQAGGAVTKVGKG